MKTLTWHCLGTIEQAQQSTLAGVYMLVHQGCYKRIVYVGTSNCIGRRMQQHYAGFLAGRRSIWKVTKEHDIYSLMSAYGIHNYINYYKQLAAQDKVWAATTLDTRGTLNLFAPKQDFDSSWQDFVKDVYLPNIEVWALNISPYDAKTAVKIESAIQQRVNKAFNLGRYFNHKDYSILGKIEFNNYIVKAEYKIENVPSLDHASQIILQNLDKKLVPEQAYNIAKKQLKRMIESRNTINAKQALERAINKDKYPKYGQAWSQQDMEKLRVMLVDFNLQAADMEQYLERPASSIKKRIEKNDRFSQLAWRQSITYLT